MGAHPTTAVFVVARGDAEFGPELAYLQMGDGPSYLFTKPYHLCGIELAAALAEALLGGHPTIAPGDAPVAAVFATAKRALAVGDTLERIGGTTHYGVIELAPVVAREGLLPVGLARGARLVRPVAAGAPLTLADVEADRSTTAWRLHAELEHEPVDGVPCAARSIGFERDRAADAAPAPPPELVVRANLTLGEGRRPPGARIEA